MKNPYDGFPHLVTLPVAALTNGFRRVCKQALAEGWTPEQMLAEVDELLAKEQYELAQAIIDSVAEFRNNPQLCFHLK
jgi:hypothetical protein